MDLLSELDLLWENELSEIRYGKFSIEIYQKIKDILSRDMNFGKSIPIEFVKNLWFIPLFLEWQKDFVLSVNPGLEAQYHAMLSWVVERLGEIFGNP